MDPPKIRPQRPNQRIHARARLLILLAEGDPYAAELQEYFLKTEGFEVEVTLDEEAARKSFSEKSPSLAVVERLISGGASHPASTRTGSAAAVFICSRGLPRFAHRRSAGATRAAVIRVRTFHQAPSGIPVRRPTVFSRPPAR